MRVLRGILYWLVQLVWGLPQTLAGFVMFLIFRRGYYRTFHGAVVCKWKRHASASIGPFLFLDERLFRGVLVDSPQRVLVHEYGHTIQSLVLGPLYLVIVGIASALWANLPAAQRSRSKRGIDYYSFPTERNADWLGVLTTGEQLAG